MNRLAAASPRKAPRQARARASVDAILDAAAHILIEEGFDAATTNRIADRAGVSIGSLYQYFPNREAVLLGVARKHSAEMLSVLADTAVRLDAAPIEVAVREYVRAMIRAHTLQPALHRALVRVVLEVGLDQIHDLQAQARAVVSAWLLRHRDEIRPCDIDAAAFVLVQAVESVVHATLLDGSSGMTPESLEEEVTTLVTRYLVRDDALKPSAPPRSKPRGPGATRAK